jgi:hypothetical protein
MYRQLCCLILFFARSTYLSDVPKLLSTFESVERDGIYRVNSGSTRSGLYSLG